MLLPETIPFIAELMEDSDPHVEKLSKELVKKINSFLVRSASCCAGISLTGTQPSDDQLENYF